MPLNVTLYPFVASHKQVANVLQIATLHHTRFSFLCTRDGVAELNQAQGGARLTDGHKEVQTFSHIALFSLSVFLFVRTYGSHTERSREDEVGRLYFVNTSHL